ncbi:MAG: polyprenyl synthetase family protein [Flavobacteriaceae bacterium]|nr:polyprenyl synthetase family protein [Flavobacteriaceae bacterium]
MPSFDKHQKLFLEYLESSLPRISPENLYRPTKYILELGGKRIRPILTLISTEVFDGEIKKALPAALAIEVFHNFSLIHDDIMDEAPLRRGKQTVHNKWNVSTAILSGDVMLIWSYELLQQYSPDISFELIKIFSQTARKVCEGQQLDMDFPNQKNICLQDYMLMIKNKTAVLLGFSLSIGAIISKATVDQINEIYNIGVELGLAFQLQDDYLDVFGEAEKFGKKIGVDIIENKKTFLYLYVLANSTERVRNEFNYWIKLNPKNPNNKISSVTSIYRSSGAEDAIKNKIEYFYKSAILKIDKLELNPKKKKYLVEFVNKLVNRSF